MHNNTTLQEKTPMANSSKPGAGYDVPPEMREFAERRWRGGASAERMFGRGRNARPG